MMHFKNVVITANLTTYLAINSCTGAKLEQMISLYTDAFYLKAALMTHKSVTSVSY